MTLCSQGKMSGMYKPAIYELSVASSIKKGLKKSQVRFIFPVGDASG